MAATGLVLLAWSLATAHAQSVRDERLPTQPTVATLQLPRNFHKASENLYRSAQPNSEELRTLYEQYGVRTVISLKTTGNDANLKTDLPIRIVPRLALNPRPFRVEQVRQDRPKIVRALRELRRAVQQGPALVHCTNGSDRTGLVTALYRVLYDDKSKEDAIKELNDPKYGFFRPFRGIPAFIREVDIDQLRREIGAF